MSEPLKPYEKAGRVIRLLAWISIIGLIGIACAVIIPVATGGVPVQGGELIGGIVLIVFFVLLVAFQFILGTAIKEHKDWGRIVGIIYGLLQLFGFPIGTIIGIYVLYCLIKGWDE